MSDHIPFEIQTEIMKRLPVKSLMRFRSVSKPWKSLIDSSQFVSDYSHRQTQPHLFIRYEDPDERVRRYVSIVDDDNLLDNLSEKICDMSEFLPNSIKQMGPTFVGSSQGLLCFFGSCRAIIWNPCIRKSVEYTTPAPVIASVTLFGFGVCLKTSEPKLVKITFSSKRVDVFSFKTGSWRSLSFSIISNLLCKSFKLSRSNECVDGFIYWCASNIEDAVWVVISFDVTNEELGVIHLPDSFAHYSNMNLSKIKDSLVLLPYDYHISKRDYEVWMMEGGVTKSFKRLFTMNLPFEFVTKIAFSYNGIGILEMFLNYFLINVSSIDTYEPSSKRFKHTTIKGIHGSFYMSSYMETLLLHDK